MCGILGSVDKYFSLETLDLLHHRGPDDFGYDKFDIFNHSVLISQRRLSIQDLSPAGHQPMISDCGNYIITFNGEIYNHWDLRKSLRQKTFKGNSDTETILYYIKEFGISSVKEFNGIFAFALLDKVQNKLFLVRDHYGVKPLYYNFQDNSFIFSSEIKAITAITKTSLNVKALANMLMLRYNPAPYTLFEGINKLRCGHILEIDLKKPTLETVIYPFIKEGPRQYFTGKLSDATKRYGELIELSVKRQLLSDIEVGILLSGGIDSAVVASLAQKHSPYKMKAFTVGFDGIYEENEIEDARETARFIGLDFFEKRITFNDFLGLAKECTRIVEEPLATTSIIPMFYLTEMASEKVHVVLTGQGADEPLGGYPRYQGELYRELFPKFVLQQLPGIFKTLNIKKESLLRAGNSLSINDDILRFIQVYSTFGNNEIEKLIGIKDTLSEELISYYYNLLNCSSLKHSIERMMKVDVRMNLADDLLNYTDKISMNFTLETRVPLLDTELIEFIESLPYNYRVKLNKTKIIHKKYAESILPKFIINRPKKGFKSPTNTWFREKKEILSDILLNPGSRFSTHFDLKEVENIIKQHQMGYNREKQLFLLLSTYYFMEENNL